GVVGGRLVRFFEPGVEIQVECDRQSRATSECFESWAESGLGEDGRMDAARDLSELVERSAELVGNERQLAPELAGRLRRHPLRRACLQRERDEALLNPVVQV